MRTKTATAVLLLLLAALSACGGSGSSGFDVTPFGENALIANVLETRQCGDSGELRICPAGGAVTGTPGPGQTPGNGRDVTVDLPEGAPVPCTLAGDSNACTFVLSFHTEGFPSDSVFGLAVRSAEPEGAWTIGELAPASPTDSFAVPLDVPSRSASIQIAVLVFPAASQPAAGSFATLGETGASFAFVTDVLAVSTLP